MTDVGRKNLANIGKKKSLVNINLKNLDDNGQKILDRHQQKILMTDVNEKITLTNII